MKKVIRIITAALCAAMIGATLCSCRYLDEKKENNAVFTDDSKEYIEFRDHTYKRIELPSGLTAMVDYDFGVEPAYVTEKDVPVLLNSMYGLPFIYDSKVKNPLILQLYEGNDLMDESDPILRATMHTYGALDRNQCYIREDKYDEVKNEIQKAKLDHYYYYDADFTDYSLNYDFSDPMQLTPELKPASEELTSAINDSLKSGKKVNYQKLIDKDSWSSFCLGCCDKNMLVTDDTKNLYILCENVSGKYYLVQTTNMYSKEKDLITVPDQYSSVFKQLFTEQKEYLYIGARLEDYFEMDETDASAYIESSTDSQVFWI